ncbi:MAG: nucleotidyl transferase AbiEii/AbiGii toxin family protein [Deltaproteobacteria bacterium]|nr:nucleotidyl transferase AbiEii/AbiGii toxin family protein [Deltaproteobacteria bacterium]
MERLANHETFEMEALQWLRSKGFLRSLVFGGGTMLRLCHEMPRYSLDMDFWFYKEVEYDAFYNQLENLIGQEYDVTDMQNKFYSILAEFRKGAGMQRLKIEIRKTLAPGGSTEEKIAFSPHFPTQVLVRGFTLGQMFRNKVSALLDRGEIRDGFDLEFLARSGVTLDLSEEEKEGIIKRLRGFKKRDFSVKLGSLLLSELREYYNQKRFAYLEEKLSFDKWST